MKLHPFNLRKRMISHNYRKKQFAVVISETEKLLQKIPNDIFLLEIQARAYTSQRNWKEGARLYQLVYEMDSEYLDCALQLARCAVYVKNWAILDTLSKYNNDIIKKPEIARAFNKKITSLSDREFVNLTSYQDLVETLPNECLRWWAGLSFKSRPNVFLSIDRRCLDELIGGEYFGYVLCIILERSQNEMRNTLEYFCRNHSITDVAGWLNPALERNKIGMENISELFLHLINPMEMNLSFLEAVCVTETLPKTLEEMIKQYLSHCSENEAREAVRVIGRKSDPRKYFSDESLDSILSKGLDLSNSDAELHTWMFEHLLRVQNYSLLSKLFYKQPKGLLKLTLNCLSNLITQQNQERMVEILDLIITSNLMLTNIKIRHSICDVLLKISEPEVAHSFAMESILLEPQDAKSGLMALNGAILTGCSKLILETADIVLNMRSRSSNIDYSKIAIAAIRLKNYAYAEGLLEENRLTMNLNAQRVRIGLQFFEHHNYQRALEEIENTPPRFRNDHTIRLYHVFSLANIGQFEEAIRVVNTEINHPGEKGILSYLLEMLQNNTSKAKKVLDSMMEGMGVSKFPKIWLENNMQFKYLLQEAPSKVHLLDDQILVTIIMTTHRWNEFFPVAVNSILNQSHQNFELIVVDDCSPLSDVELYDKLLEDSRIKRIRMGENVGTYACRNKGLESAKGEFVTFADNDDWIHPEKIEMSLNFIQEEDLDLIVNRFIRVSKQGKLWFNGNKLTQFSLVGMMVRKSKLNQFGLQFDGRSRFGADSEFLERAEVLFGQNKIKKTNFIELVALHHQDSLTGGGGNQIDWTGPGDVRQRYANGYQKNLLSIKSGVDDPQIKNFSPPTNDTMIPNPSKIQQRIRTLLGVEVNNYSRHRAPILGDKTSENIFAFMATYPGGFSKVGKAVESLLNQTHNLTKLILHVNGNTLPSNLPDDPRLEVIASEEDYADNGKFKHMSNHSGYILTVDDDINYPEDYVEKMIEYVEQFGKKALVGIHGATLPYGPPITRWSYYRDMRRTHGFTEKHSSFCFVNVLGTGTLAFHSDLGIPNVDDMDTKRMVDLHVAVWAQKQGTPMVACLRAKNWLTEFEDAGDNRIWQQANTDRELQNQMILTIRKIPFWEIGSNRACKLKKGPLSTHKEWISRELPPSMKLPPLQEWAKLPEMPKVTIYIPAYNVESYIEECVDSALAQTYENYEISIHDDGSTDNTLKILKSKYGKTPKVKISTNVNQGISSATNQAISNGDGELILQLDSDDLIEPNTLILLVKAIQDGHVCAYGNFRRISPDGSFIDDGWEEPTFDRARLMKDMIVHPPRLFRRDVWEFIGKHNTELSNAEDFDLFVRMSEVGTMVHVREILYSYRILESSSSRVHADIMTQNTYTVIENSLKRQNLEKFQLIIPNLNFPRRITFIRSCFTE